MWIISIAKNHLWMIILGIILVENIAFANKSQNKDQKKQEKEKLAVERAYEIESNDAERF